ncbi:MAG: transposase, partial [Anaerolineae bacterium]|nr:transposase [Anaerolineae bacterium]
MFIVNTKHLQPKLFSTISQLPEKQRKMLEVSWADTFYREVFCRIKEETFSVLYSESPSRPNVPVNLLVGLEILKAGYGWSDAELIEHYYFDIQVRYALGYDQLGDG